jgi:hypothetical protein
MEWWTKLQWVINRPYKPIVFEMQTQSPFFVNIKKEVVKIIFSVARREGRMEYFCKTGFDDFRLRFSVGVEVVKKLRL